MARIRASRMAVLHDARMRIAKQLPQHLARLPMVDVTNDAKAYPQLLEAMTAHVPGLYEWEGAAHRIVAVHGYPRLKKVDPHTLRGMFAEHVCTYRLVGRTMIPKLLTVTLCRTLLAHRPLPVPHLAELPWRINVRTLRTPGVDRTTGLYVYAAVEREAVRAG
ncbi:hypothetical protein ACMATS_05920 [Streptoverticillium reticulum]|uniref:hypothetical protein n=1 Tax=Streptoverticillium reticulum TaxID=1433415 RepID=UPI0039BFB8EC